MIEREAKNARSGIILHCNNHLLLVKTLHNGVSEIWGFAKGRVIGSDPKISAEREFYEETGIPFVLDGEYTTFRISNTRYYMQRVPIMFPLTYENVPDKREIHDVRWVPITDLLTDESTYQMNKTLKLFIQRHLHKMLR